MHEVPWFYVGVDLGQAQDYTAIAVVERLVQVVGEDGRPAGVPEQGRHYGRQPKTQSQLHVRHLERLPLGMPYDEQAEHIKNLVQSPELQSRHATGQLWGELSVRNEEVIPPGLAIDGTGVGRAAANLLSTHGLEFDAITLHGGDSVSHADGYTRLPKRDLVSVLQVAFQSGWLKIAKELELAETLRQELLNFKVKIDPKTAHDSYSYWREGQHDDLVLSAGMACWAATKPQRRFWSGSYSLDDTDDLL